MEWIFLSPHFDDIALSCGGLVWEIARAGDPVSVWTICAGEIPDGDLSEFAQELHTRWQTGSQAREQRQAEDADSCWIMGAGRLLFDIPDAVYRSDPATGEHFYPTVEAIFGELHPQEQHLVTTLSQAFRSSPPENYRWVCPLTLGGHVDHQLARRAAEKMRAESPGCEMWYYADYPYALDNQAYLEELAHTGWQCERFAISEAGVRAWEASIAAHASQISTFWQDRESLKTAIRQYAHAPYGNCLWKKISS